MAEEITRSYRHSHSPDVVVSERSGSAAAIVAIIVVLVIAAFLALMYYNNWGGFRETVIVNEAPSPAPVRETVTNTNTRETNTNTIIQPTNPPASSPTTTSAEQGATQENAGAATARTS